MFKEPSKINCMFSSALHRSHHRFRPENSSDHSWHGCFRSSIWKNWQQDSASIGLGLGYHNTQVTGSYSWKGGHGCRWQGDDGRIGCSCIRSRESGLSKQLSISMSAETKWCTTDEDCCRGDAKVGSVAVVWKTYLFNSSPSFQFKRHRVICMEW